MLVLTRKLGESIRIGDSVVITVLKIKGNAVRIGIDAPKYVTVIRSEVDNKNTFKFDKNRKKVS